MPTHKTSSPRVNAFGTLPCSQSCPVTGLPIDEGLGRWRIRFRDDDGSMRDIVVGAADATALTEIRADPQGYGVIAWTDHLAQFFEQTPTSLPLSY